MSDLNKTTPSGEVIKDVYEVARTLSKKYEPAELVAAFASVGATSLGRFMAYSETSTEEMDGIVAEFANIYQKNAVAAYNGAVIELKALEAKEKAKELNEIE